MLVSCLLLGKDCAGFSVVLCGGKFESGEK
jgi:hypothetical protein